MSNHPRKPPEPAPEVGPEAPGSRWLTMPAVGDLLGLSERAARDWVRRHELPTRGSRPVRVSAQVDLAAMAEEERVARKPPEVTLEPPGSSPEAPGSSEPIEVAYRVAGEAAAEVALVPLATMVEELRGLADQLQEMSRRNEALALEVGTLRERQVGHEAQLAARDLALGAKDETIATQREALTGHVERVVEQQETIAELRWRAEAAEAERDRLAAAQAAQVAQETQGTTETAEEPSQGVWARLGRWWGG